MEKTGWNILSDLNIAYPFINHLHFADKRDLILPSQPVPDVAGYLQRNRIKYRQFIRQKNRHPSLDIYACFQPFNECFKALFPFVDYLKSQLKPGDIILNLWDRSGWTASMLGGWFPDQKICTIWEGDKDILGYKGFDYWMSADRRQNHTVIFSDFLRPLPVETASVSLVIGMDLLHRFNQPELIQEINRVSKAGAPVIFPHVHLTNNMPDPFFERGCRQLHGNDYDYLFEQLKPTTGRQAYVYSEPALFRFNDIGEGTQIAHSEPGHTDYNGCIAWLDPKTDPWIRPWRGHEQPWDSMYLLQNPLLTIDPVRHTIQFNLALYGSLIPELLEQHGVYAKRIERSLSGTSGEAMIQMLYWAGHGYTLGRILFLMGIGKIQMQQLLEEAWELDLAQVVPVDHAGFRLQHLLGQQKYILETEEQNLYSFWQDAISVHGDSIWIRSQDITLTFAEADELIGVVRKALLEEGFKAGDNLMICTPLRIEALLLFWAATGMGMVVVPMSPRDSLIKINNCICRFSPVLVLSEPTPFQTIASFGKFRAITTDETSAKGYDSKNGFEMWLGSFAERTEKSFRPPAPEDIAVILSTTGSTGNPKFIPVSHARLIRSGRVMTETYQWKKDDRYLGLGGLETMSGLRHATVSVTEAGAACVLAEAGTDLRGYTDLIIRESVTILAANPIFYKQILLLMDKKSWRGGRFTTLRLALSTGNMLSRELRNQWQAQTGIGLYNYYGLTETTGICIAESPGEIPVDDKSIGFPIDCLVKIIDKNGMEVESGVTGELCIYGACVFDGYYQNQEATRLILNQGWFRTGDLAVQWANGSLSLMGRISDIVKLPGGERVELAALEEILGTMEGLSDWTVCPIKENEKESIIVFVVPTEPVCWDDLKKDISNRIAKQVGSYAMPSGIERVDQIPRGNHHKVLRQELIGQFFSSDNLQTL